MFEVIVRNVTESQGTVSGWYRFKSVHMAQIIADEWLAKGFDAYVRDAATKAPVARVLV